MINISTNQRFVLLSLCVSVLLFPLSALGQVGYTVLTPDAGSRAPTGTALFTFVNSSGMLVSQAGVGAVEPISSGRIFVDERGTRTAFALANPNAQAANVEMVLRDEFGAEVATRPETLDAGTHLARFVSELFTALPPGFTGSLSFTSSQPLGSISLRESLNRSGEAMYSTLPVVDLNAAPVSDPVAFPHIAIGEGYTTQIVLINPTGQTIRGQIRLTDSGGQPLVALVAQNTASDIPYEIPPHGTFQPELESVTGLKVGYAVATPDPGSTSPAGTAIFLFRSNNQLVTEAGVAATPPTTAARIFVDHGGTRTGVAIANAGTQTANMVITLLDRNGFPKSSVTRALPPGNHLAIFAHELFPELVEGFTGLMEIQSTSPIVPVTLKLTTVNTATGLALTTLPIADLNRPPEAPLLIFPQIAIGGGFSTRLILLNADAAFPSRGSLSFFQSDGNLMTVPVAGVTGSRFDFEVVGGSRFFPGNSASVASVSLIDPRSNEVTFEMVVNEGESARPMVRVIDSQGSLRDDFSISLTSVSQDVATVDNSLGLVFGRQAGFSTMVIRAGEAVATATISVVNVVSGLTGFGTAIVQDQAQRLYVASAEEHTIRSSVDLKQSAELYAGVERTPGLRDAERLESLFKAPSALVIDYNTGKLYISDSENHVIRTVPLGGEGQVETFAGTGSPGDKDGAVAAASFNDPQGIALDNTGNLWVVDSGNHTVRRIDLVSGTVQTVAGETGTPGAADGTGADARFRSPVGIALEPETQARRIERELLGLPPPQDHLIVADTGNGTLRRISSTGEVETLMQPVSGITVPGSKKLWSSKILSGLPVLPFNSPTGVAVDASGNIYVTEPDTHQVRVILASSEVVSISPPDAFEQPEGILIGRGGRILIADSKRSVQEIRFGAPVITTIEPFRVSNLGGDSVTIRGRNFEPNSIVIVGGVQVTSASQTDTETISFAAPPLPSGLVTVTVQTRGGLDQKPLLVDPVPLSALPSGQITTIAGGNTFASDGTLAVQAQVAFPTSLAFGAGSIFIADFGNNRIRRVDAITGIISTVAGTGRRGFSRDNESALVAGLANPQGVAVDVGQNLYIADTGNNRIRRVDAATGIITTIAGTGQRGSSGDDALAVDAALDTPTAIGVDGARNVFVADSGNHRVRRIDALTGIITTIAGTGQPGSSGEAGPAVNATLDSPGGVAVDDAGNVFIADTGNHRILRVDAGAGLLTILAGTGQQGFSDGSALAASFYGPRGIGVDRNGNVFVADWGNSRIRKIDVTTGMVTTIAGNGTFGFSGDNGLATEAGLGAPFGVASDSAGDIFIADTFIHRIRRVNSEAGVITTVAGDGFTQFSGDNGFAHGASLSQPEGIARDSSGNLFIADTSNHRIRRVDGVTGIITTIAGNGENGFSGDGEAATDARLSSPESVAVDLAGNLFVADTFNSRIRRVELATGTIATVAGNGEYGFSGDGGPATEAALADPSGIAVDSNGNLYIADSTNNRVRFVDATNGFITTIAGDGDLGFSGDDGPASSASLYNPGGVAFDGSGNLLIADTGNNVIRQVTTDGIITTIAGNGEWGFEGDGGPAILASLADPSGVATDEAGNLFIADTFNDRIRRVDFTTGIIATLAGSGRYGFSGDNVIAMEAALADPGDVLVDEIGNVYIADSTNDRIRGVRGSIPTPPTEGCSPITPGQTLNGNLDANDRLSRNRTGVPADCYTFTGNLGDRFAVEMNSTEIDPYLFLMNNVGRIIEFDDDGCEGLNAAIPSSGTLILPASGTYVIEATSFSESTEGGYSLTLTVGADTPQECSPIAFGQSIDSDLSRSDARSVHRQSYADCYTFSAAEGDRVEVTLTSPDFDTYLYLVNPANQLIASNDDTSGNTDSRIPDSGSIALLDGGTHTIEVTSFHSSGFGSYSLALVGAADSTALTCSTITPGQGITANLDVGDLSSRNRSGSRADCYSFLGEAGARLTIAMDSSDFDTYLYLMDAAGEVIDSNDDGGTGTNSIAIVTLPVTGGYIVEATSFGTDGEGSYTLSITPEAIPTPLVCSPISLGQRVEGTLDSNDGASQTRLGAQADCYTFSNSSDDQISISLSSEEFDTFLFLFDAEGEVLEFDDDGGAGSNSRISGREISASTIYTIETTSFYQGATGAYTLSLSRVSLNPSIDCGPIIVGELIQGDLEIDDRELRHRSGSRSDCYTFLGSAGDRIDISMSSDDFDTYLFLLDAAGEVLIQDDDGGDSVNSRIASFDLPSTGTFIIEATSFSAGAVGQYSLALTRFVADACVPISYGQTLEGDLATTDSESGNRTGSRADCYTFAATVGDRISISLSSDEFDTYVVLLDAAGDVLAFDDGGGEGTNSQILSFSAPSTGTLTIEATSYSSGTTGMYTLMLIGTGPPECTPLGYGQTLEGNLSPSDPTSVFRTSSQADCYRFSATQGDQIVISMNSIEFDTYLYLIDPAGQSIAFDDDGGDGTNSRIPDAGAVAIPATGVYTIEATSFRSDQTGGYSLTLQRPDALSLTITAPSPKGKTKPDPYARPSKDQSGKPVKTGTPKK